ncbi:MAG TPA: 3-dehydroquinate synthase [Nitrospira sp.]|nr:3-dehydroquinate synthase [Nitrospira sp.]
MKLGERSYDIIVRTGLLRSLGADIARLTKGPLVGIVTDQHVARHYLKEVGRSLRREGLEPIPIVLRSGERSKTLNTVRAILDSLAEHRFERQSLMLALGGGVVGDLAGFAAAIYHRGISFVQVPTSLVAQVDSSVGGKTGVDHRLGKNLIGAFHQPRTVLIDPDTLRTLPQRELRAGMAEIIKYGVIADEEFFAFLEDAMPALLNLDAEMVLRTIARCCEIKAQIVGEDERESDRRRVLNYGHTIGHALESLGGYRQLIHGEAVGIGLVQEADLARQMGLCKPEVVERIKTLVGRAGLSDRMPDMSFSSLWGAMQHDKKVIGGQVMGVWPLRIGEVVIRPLEKPVCADWYRRRRERTAFRSNRRQEKVTPVRRSATMTR